MQLRTAVKKARKRFSEETLLQVLGELGVSPAQIEHLHLATRKQEKPVSKRKTTSKKATKKKAATPKVEKEPEKRPTTWEKDTPCTKKAGCGRGLGHPGQCYRKRGSPRTDVEEKKKAPPPKPPPAKRTSLKANNTETAADGRAWVPCPDPSKCFHPGGKGHEGEHQPKWVKPKEECFIRSCGREKGHTQNHYPRSLILAR